MKIIFNSDNKLPLNKTIETPKMTIVSIGKSGFNYFVDYKDAKKIRPFYIFLPKMNAYRKDFS